MDLLGTCRVDLVRQSPRTRAYGFFAKGTVPTSLVLAHLVSFLFPTVFAGCLPRPTSVAGCPGTRPSPCVWYCAAVLLTEHRSRLRSRPRITGSTLPHQWADRCITGFPHRLRPGTSPQAL